MKKLIFLCSALFLLSACSNNSADHSHEASHSHDHEHEKAHEPVNTSALASVKLNNGEAWSANAATTEGIHNMMQQIEDFEESGSDDYAALQSDLQNEFNLIIKKCTMKGEAHNQLHNYLMPLKQDLENLSAENLNEVKNHLKAYPTYFE